MVREIVKDVFFLSQKSTPATADDLDVAQDLLDTLTAHKDGCVGMAANMIGVSKRIITFDNEGKYMVMYNPEIKKNQTPMKRRKVVCLWPEPAKPNAGNPSRFNIKTNSFRPVSKLLPAGLLKSSSTKSIIATASLFDNKYRILSKK